jgi:cytochrome P450
MPTHMTDVPAHVPPGLVRDFDLDFRAPLEQLFPKLDSLRSEGRALWMKTGLGGSEFGAWLFTDAEDIRTALQHPDLFSSQLGGDGNVPMIPIFMDPPEHTKYRRLLNPLFAPAVMAKMEEGVQRRIHSIVERLVDKGSCDFVADVAIQFPTRVFTSWIGLPEQETGTFVALVSALIHGGTDEAARDTAMADAFAVLSQLISERQANPTDDLMSQIISLNLDDRPLTQNELLRIAFLLFLAGLDTVAAAMSFSFWHLAQTPEDREGLRNGRIPSINAVEELLRRYSFVNLPRLVARDTKYAGVQLKRGDHVVLSTPMASRDPHEHHTSSVDFERRASRNYAFGAGPHRCLGAHLARLEMRLALEEWHRRIPDYGLDGEVGSHGGTVMGVNNLPLRW